MLGIRMRIWLLATAVATLIVAGALLRGPRNEKTASAALPLPVSRATEQARVAVRTPSERTADDPTVRMAAQPERATPPEPSRGSTRTEADLVVAEDAAARTALRRGLSVPLSGTSGEADVHPTDGRSWEADRRRLSDELIVNHLVAEAYRTTGFSYDQDAAGETRAAAMAQLQNLRPEDRLAILEESIVDESDRPQPQFEPALREQAEPPR